MTRERRALRLALGALLLAGVGAGLLRLAAPPAGPVEPAWDRVACAHCRMLVSDARFAAQLHTPSGEVRFYDDPGCLLVARSASGAEAGSASGAEAGSAWFHDSAAHGWLAEAETRFVRVAESPMGYGFAAVRAGSAPDALDAAAAHAALAAQAEGAR